MHTKKEKILIIFEGQWLAYSPTVIQLYDELVKQYEVHIFAERPRGELLQKPHIAYWDYATGFKRYPYKALFSLLSVLDPVIKHFRFPNNNYQDFFFRYLPIKRLLKKNKYKKVICVDIKNLLFCSLLKVRVDYLSLEIVLNENLLPYIDTGIIDRVIIQRMDRYKYLFKEVKLPTFIVQNAPSYKEVKKSAHRRQLIFTGTVNKEFGIFFCLDYLLQYRDDSMVILGNVNDTVRGQIEQGYRELLDNGQLVIEKKYLDNDEVVEFIAGFEIGFCLYNFDTNWVQNYNYQTAPSGKVFKYLAAGVPAICNDILGFDMVREFQCGELLTDMSPASIRGAIEKIRSNYAAYSENAVKAAQHFSFDKSIQPYIDYVNSSPVVHE